DAQRQEALAAKAAERQEEQRQRERTKHEPHVPGTPILLPAPGDLDRAAEDFDTEREDETGASGEEVRALVVVTDAKLDEAERRFWGKTRTVKPTTRARFSEGYHNGAREAQGLPISHQAQIG